MISLPLSELHIPLLTYIQGELWDVDHVVAGLVPLMDVEEMDDALPVDVIS